MRALVFDGALWLVADYSRPSPGPSEALVKVRLAGICNTDLEIVKGYMGFKAALSFLLWKRWPTKQSMSVP